MDAAAVVYSIGHSRHPLDRFVALLDAAGVRLIVDVRSQPYSKWAPQFRKEPLARALADHGVEYRFAGKQLGGRPDDRSCYDDQGRVVYARRTLATDFQNGIDRLVELAGQVPTAMLCAEEDPRHCHRRLLLTPAIQARGFEVVHLRGDGRLQADAQIEPSETQLGLFGKS